MSDRVSRFGLTVAAAATAVGLALSPSAPAHVAAVAVFVAALLVSGWRSAPPVDLVLVGGAVLVGYLWLRPGSGAAGAVTVVLACGAVIVALAGMPYPTLRATGVAIAAVAVLSTAFVDAPLLRWVGVAAAVVAAFARVATPRSSDPRLVGAVTSDLTAGVLAATTIATMGVTDEVGRGTLVPLVVLLFAISAGIVRWGRLRALVGIESARSAIDGADDLRVEVDRFGLVARASAGARALGFEPGSALVDVVDIGSTDLVLAALAEARSGGGREAIHVQVPGGAHGFLELSTEVTFLDPSVESWLFTFVDETESILANRQRVQELASLRDAVKIDRLTGALNRVGIVEAIAQRLAEENGCVIFLDLNGFKQVNDTHGHDVGDWVLTTVAHRIKRLLGADWNLGRIGGDEFVIEGPEEGLDLEELADLRGIVRMPIAYASIVVEVDTSIGVATGWRGADPDEVIRAADRAMYVEKKSGNAARPGGAQAVGGEIQSVAPRNLGAIFRR